MFLSNLARLVQWCEYNYDSLDHFLPFSIDIRFEKQEGTAEESKTYILIYWTENFYLLDSLTVFIWISIIILNEVF